MNNYAFIDSQNLNLGVKSQGWNLNFARLIEYLVKQNKMRKVIVPNLHFSSLLRKFSNFIVNIQLFKEKLTK